MTTTRTTTTRRVTRSERLLREMKLQGGMTHGECVQFLMDLANGFGNTEYDSYRDRGLYSALLYGTRDRTGLYEKYCEQGEDGRYRVVRTITGPYTGYRRIFPNYDTATVAAVHWPSTERRNVW